MQHSLPPKAGKMKNLDKTLKGLAVYRNKENAEIIIGKGDKKKDWLEHPFSSQPLTIKENTLCHSL